MARQRPPRSPLPWLHAYRPLAAKANSPLRHSEWQGRHGSWPVMATAANLTTLRDGKGHGERAPSRRYARIAQLSGAWSMVPRTYRSAYDLLHLAIIWLPGCPAGCGWWPTLTWSRAARRCQGALVLAGGFVIAPASVGDRAEIVTGTASLAWLPSRSRRPCRLAVEMPPLSTSAQQVRGTARPAAGPLSPRSTVFMIDETIQGPGNHWLGASCGVAAALGACRYRGPAATRDYQLHSSSS